MKLGYGWIIAHPLFYVYVVYPCHDYITVAYLSVLRSVLGKYVQFDTGHVFALPGVHVYMLFDQSYYICDLSITIFPVHIYIHIYMHIYIMHLTLTTSEGKREFPSHLNSRWKVGSEIASRKLIALWPSAQRKWDVLSTRIDSSSKYEKLGHYCWKLVWHFCYWMNNIFQL